MIQTIFDWALAHKGLWAVCVILPTFGLAMLVMFIIDYRKGK